MGAAFFIINVGHHAAEPFHAHSVDSVAAHAGFVHAGIRRVARVGLYNFLSRLRFLIVGA